MTKKKSIEKKGMTPEDVRAEIAKFKGNENKLKCLRKILASEELGGNRRVSLTSASALEVLGDLEFEGDNKYDSQMRYGEAAKIYERTGDLASAERLYEKAYKSPGGRDNWRFEYEDIREKRKNKGRNSALALILIISSIGGAFFLSSNLTGNVIGSLNQTSSNWIGGVLFLIGLVGAFAYFKKR